jgi:hypothetical protein
VAVAAAVLTVTAAAGVAVATAGGAGERALQVQEVTPSASTAGSGSEEKIAVSLGANVEGHRPDHTAGDWVTYADHVVVATVIGDEDSRPIHENSGHGWYDRKVTLKVDELLWSNSHAARPVPTTFTHPGWGYIFTDGDPTRRTKWAVQDYPRIELGHRYIIAFAWEPARCSPGDTPSPGRWEFLGRDSVIPYDGPVIGTGEMSGRLQDAAQARAALPPAPPSPSLEDEMLGRTTSDLGKALANATPVPEEQYSTGTCAAKQMADG